MASKQLIVFPQDQLEHSELASFSFDHSKPSALKQTHKKSIDDYLRLKTNESIEDRLYIGNSQQLDTYSYSKCKRSSVSVRKSLKTEQAEAHENEYKMHLMQQQNQLRIVSITKQYELKLSKQQQLFQLRQWKLNEELQNMGQQNQNLQDQIKKIKNGMRTQQNICTLCSDGEVITHLTKVLQEIQQNHKGCLQTKKQLMKKIHQSESKLTATTDQNQNIHQQSKNLAKQMRSLRQTQTHLQKDNAQQATQIEQMQRRWLAKQQSYQQKINQLQRKLSSIQGERSSIYIKDQESIHNSKATIQSTQSILNNIENSLKSSYIRGNSKQNIEPMGKTRTSMTKILQSIENLDRNDYESRIMYRKMSDNSKQQRSSIHKPEQQKFKYF